MFTPKKVIQSNVEPSKHNLWLKDGVMHGYGPNGWRPICGGESSGNDGLPVIELDGSRLPKDFTFEGYAYYIVKGLNHIDSTLPHTTIASITNQNDSYRLIFQTGGDVEKDYDLTEVDFSDVGDYEFQEINYKTTSIPIIIDYIENSRVGLIRSEKVWNQVKHPQSHFVYVKLVNYNGSVEFVPGITYYGDGDERYIKVFIFAGTTTNKISYITRIYKIVKDSTRVEIIYDENFTVDNSIIKILNISSEDALSLVERQNVHLEIEEPVPTSVDSFTVVLNNEDYGPVCSCTMNKLPSSPYDGYMGICLPVESQYEAVTNLICIQAALSNFVVQSYNITASPVLVAGGGQPNESNLKVLQSKSDNTDEIGVLLLNKSTDISIYPIYATLNQRDNEISYISGTKLNVYDADRETGKIKLKSCTDLAGKLPVVQLLIGDSSEVKSANLLALSGISGHFFTSIDYGFGTGTFIKKSGGFAHVSTAYGNDVFYTINTDGSVIKNEDYIKPNEPYTVHLKASDIGTTLSEVVGAHVSNAGEIIVVGSTGPITYTRTSDSTTSAVYFTNDRKDGKITLLTYNTNSRLISASIIEPSGGGPKMILVIPVTPDPNKVFTDEEILGMFSGISSKEQLYNALKDENTIFYSSNLDLLEDIVLDTYQRPILMADAIQVIKTPEGEIENTYLRFGSRELGYVLLFQTGNTAIEGMNTNVVIGEYN